jgi:hypothetical protein
MNVTDPSYARTAKPRRHPWFVMYSLMFWVSVVVFVVAFAFMVRAIGSIYSPADLASDFRDALQRGDIEAASMMVSDSDPLAKTQIRSAMMLVQRTTITLPLDSATSDSRGEAHYYLCTTQHVFYKYCRIIVVKTQDKLQVVGFQLSSEPLKVVP